MKLIVGLTGGIASGKSAAAEHFISLGVPLLDADEVSREVVTPGSAGLAALVKAFGEHILAADGSLNRPRMRESVFADDRARMRLEEILHPLIRHRLMEWRDSCSGPYCILMVPLLVKMGWHSLVNRLLVVDCPESMQKQRLLARDDIDTRLAERMIAAQEPRQSRLAAADDIILNTGSLAALQSAVEVCHRNYLEYAHGRIKQLPGLRLPA